MQFGESLSSTECASSYFYQHMVYISQFWECAYRKVFAQYTQHGYETKWWKQFNISL
jgi:hypothetical protein